MGLPILKPATAPAVALYCLLILHTPEGGEIAIDTHHIAAIRGADAFKGHLAAGTKTIVYTGAQNWAVIETAEQVHSMIDECGGE